LLAFLVYRGVKAMRPREASPSSGLIIPSIFFVLGVAGLFSGVERGALNFALFAGALPVGAAIGAALASLTPAPRLVRETGMLALPGSPATLVLICLAFATKYAGAVALALAADAAARADVASLMTAAGGLFGGIFWGRTLRQFQRALQSDGQAATLANLARLVLAPRAKDATEVAS
jgi:hypothetical protein